MCLATGAGPANTGMQVASIAQVDADKRIDRLRPMIAMVSFNFIPLISPQVSDLRRYAYDKASPAPNAPSARSFACIRNQMKSWGLSEDGKNIWVARRARFAETVQVGHDCPISLQPLIDALPDLAVQQARGNFLCEPMPVSRSGRELQNLRKN